MGTGGVRHGDCVISQILDLSYSWIYGLILRLGS
jgi:hypothetical protein